MQYLNFTVAETSGRTFDMPYEKAVEIINRIKAEDKYTNEIEVDLTDSYSMARFFERYGYLDEIANYETDNDYVDTQITDSEIYEI